MPDAPRLYTDLARLWPRLSPPEQYEQESEALAELIDHALGVPPSGRRWSLLELGAGGGHSVVHLRDRYDCTAADISEPMLDLCKRLNPGVPTIAGDMRSMRLGKPFDIVLICDAIDYMLSEDDAVAALTTAREHLRPGGVLLFAPTYTRETFVDGDVADDSTAAEDETTQGDAALPGVTYFTFVHDPDPSDSTFEMILLYLLRDAGTRQVEVIEDRHTCGLFSIDQWRSFAQRAGLDAEALAEPRADGAEQDASAWSVLFLARVP